MGTHSRQAKRRGRKLNYQPLEPRRVLAAIFPTYVDGTFSLGDPDSAAPYPLSDTFSLETRPNATKTIYLDFNGHFSNNNRWNHTINFPAWDRDGNANNFSDSELIEIQKQFQNVAEDFAPFDVNVTTKDPGTAALIKSSFFDQTFGVRVISSQATDEFGDGIGGVAYFNSFDDNADNPVFVFNKGANNGAMTISHEVGHAFGLAHDGLNGSTYHPGTGFGEVSWGPILGAPFSRNLSQWSNGDYAGSTSTQDDLAIITNSANGIQYKADDAGNSIASASLLEADGNAIFDWGIVERRSDVDYYEFTTGGGLIDLQVKAFAENPNLDVRLRIYRADGTQVLSNNPANGVDALVQQNFVAGTYYLAVDGVGKSGVYSDYGSLGFYSIEGTIPARGQKIGEVGTINDLTHVWRTVSFNGSYANPIVVAGTPTTNGGDPITIRIRNVASNSFEMRVEEWDYRDGSHGRERVSYMVVESGTHQLTDGTVLRASKINSQNQNWANRTFAGAFTDSAEKPVIVASVTTTRDTSAVTTRIKGVSNTGFQLKIQEEQAADQVHQGEEVSWIAIEKGTGFAGVSHFIAGETGRTVNHSSRRIDFDPVFTARPSLFAEMQTANGGDNATVRARSVVNNQALVFLEEERSADAEITHATERVGYFAIPQGDVLALSAGASVRVAGSATAMGLDRGRMIDGDLSTALAEMQARGEQSFEFAHSDDEHLHDHDHYDDDDIQFTLGFEHVESVRESEHDNPEPLDSNRHEHVNYLADHVSSSISDSTDQFEFRSPNTLDDAEEDLQESRTDVFNQSDSLFAGNVHSFDRWFHWCRS